MTSNLFFGGLVFRSRARGLRVLAAIGVSAAMLPTSLWAAPFTPGNLVVTRVAAGNVVDASAPTPTQGAVLPILTPKALGGSGEAASLFLEEFTPLGVLVQTIAVPNVEGATDGVNHALTLSGTQNGEGQITLSGDRRYFIITGYNKTPTGTTNGGTNAAASTTTARVIGRIAMDGTFDTTTALLDAGSARSARSAYSVDGTSFWYNGQSGANVTIGADPAVATSGIKYATLGATTSTSVAVSGTPNPAGNDHRMLNAFNGQLYISNTSTSTTDPDIYKVGTGIPSTSGNTLDGTTGLAGLSGNLFDDFWFKDENTLYAADNRRQTSLDGGIRKYALEAGAWVFKYSTQLGIQDGPTLAAEGEQNIGARGIAGMVNGSNTILFATTFDNTGANRNRLVRIVDDGTMMSFTNLHTAPDNGGFATAFRGVEIVPAASVINANFDGVNGVDGHDFLIWQRGLGTGSTLGQGDSDASGAVDATDLANWKTRYGNASTAAVPEPSSAALAILALTAKRRRVMVVDRHDAGNAAERRA